MKILQVSTYYLPHFGGIEQLAYDLSRILKKQGNDVEVVCFNSVSKTVSDIYEGTLVHRVGYRIKFASQAISFRYFFVLRKVIKEFKPDVVHLHLPNPLISIYILLLRQNCRLTLHWHSDIIKQEKLKRIYAPFEKLILKRAEKIAVTTKIYAENSESLKNFIDKTVVIPSIVEADFFDSFGEAKSN